jgi:DNA-binding NtrC family response regulator
MYNIVPNSNEETGLALLKSRNRSGGVYDYENEIKWLAHAVMELRNEVNDLKKMVGGEVPTSATIPVTARTITSRGTEIERKSDEEIQTAEEIVENETLNLFDMEKRNIIKALQRNHYRRKSAADDLGISERTLYRKIKDYGIEE